MPIGGLEKLLDPHMERDAPKFELHKALKSIASEKVESFIQGLSTVWTTEPGCVQGAGVEVGIPRSGSRSIDLAFHHRVGRRRLRECRQPAQDPTVGICPGPYGGPQGGGSFL